MLRRCWEVVRFWPAFGLGSRTRIKAAILHLAIFVSAVALLTVSDVRGVRAQAQQTRQIVVIEIESVSPSTAKPLDIITITYRSSARSDLSAKPDVAVYFDGERGDIIGFGPTFLLVRVPKF